MHDQTSAEDRRRRRTIIAFLGLCAAGVLAAVYLYLQPSVTDLPQPSPSATQSR